MTSSDKIYKHNAMEDIKSNTAIGKKENHVR